MTLYTIGHSTRSIDVFLDLLSEFGIASLVDVRRFPASRRHPHFSRARLEPVLEQAGIRYLHLAALGGRRDTSPGSPNTAWRNDSFRGYADHMATARFHDAIEELLCGPSPAAVMCAEAVPWRSHRNLIADELTRRGHQALHVLESSSTKPHTMNPAAVDSGGYLTYPAGGQSTLEF